MKHTLVLLLLLVLLLVLVLKVGPISSQDLGGSPSADDLLAQMTLEEKVGQMTQLTIGSVSSERQTDSTIHQIDIEELVVAVTKYQVGSIFNVYDSAFSLEHWQELIATIQDIATGQTRLGIPVIYGIDAVHGHHYMQEGTVFPHNLAMAATWNPELVRRSNEITAIEMRASGIPWNFSPVLDIGRQPLWSRFSETFGEDVYLVSKMGLAAVHGLQGEGADVGNRGHVAASLKHFLGNGLPLSGKDRMPAWIPERMLREYVLPPFRAAIEAGARTVMINSGEVNGVPVHASKWILTDLLRGELGFKGVAVTDWEGIASLHTVHRVAAGQKDAVRIAIEAGIDMSMVPNGYPFTTDLIDLVRDGSISESRIDESVRRILQLKIDLGLFEMPGHDETLVDSVAVAEFTDVSRSAARESITLLKNKGGILPLKGDERILVTGYGAASLAAFHGAWTYTWQGLNENVYPQDGPTLVDILVDELGIEKVTYVPGTDEHEEVSISAAVEEAFRADVAVIVVAEAPSTEKPGDIEDLELPETQQKLVSAVAATGTPIILVLAEGRPRIVREIEPEADGILLAYQTGPFGPEAVADIISGRVNPSGRLPFTYPRYSGSIVPYDHKNAERVDSRSRSGVEAFNPQWPFGYGLSYTDFSYGELSIANDTLASAGTGTADLRVRVTVQNTGDVAGKEVVQLYVRDLYATITPPVVRLRGFQKISREPGERKTVAFDIPISDLAFIGLDNRPVVEPGEFEVSVGGLRAGFVVAP